MGRWSQAARHGRWRAAAGAALLPGPALSALPNFMIQWVWALPDPDQWILESSSEEFGEYALINSFAGDVRADGPEEPLTWLRVYGADLAANPTTERSNPVQAVA